MAIRVHIERLVLDGLPIDRRQGVQVQVALERELARLLTMSGLHPELASGRAVPSIQADRINLGLEVSPTRLGQQIARSVYGGIGR
jgi:hypothetical protein